MTESIPIDQHMLNSKGFPFISRPKIISEYFVTRDRQIEAGRMRAKLLYEPVLSARHVDFDLNTGLETFEEKAVAEKLEILLKWIESQAPRGGRLRKAIHEANVVCWRGLLTRLACTVFDKRATWRVRAARHCGVVFLCEEETEENRQRKQNMTDREKRMTYWGHKFEQFVSIDEGLDTPDTSRAVTTREEFAGVLRTSLESAQDSAKPAIELLYAAEIDCLNRSGNYVELKTNKGELKSWFYKGVKSLKWWCQSFLVAVDTIIVGHRDDTGHVRKVSAIRTEEIQKRSACYGGAAIRFLSIVLSRILDQLSMDQMACVVEYGGCGEKVTIRNVSIDSCDFVPPEFLSKFY